VIQHLHANNYIPNALQFNNNSTRFLRCDQLSAILRDLELETNPQRLHSWILKEKQGGKSIFLGFKREGNVLFERREKEKRSHGNI
jgi:hypothetical protein